MFTYDLTTDLGLVRRFMRDTDPTAPIWDDAEVESFLVMESGSVWGAAALALETLATDQLFLLGKIQVEGLSIDGPAAADAYLKAAALLRQHAMTHGAVVDSGFDIAEILNSDWVRDEYLWNLVWAGAGF